jgi:hypothetical protein
MAHNEPGHCCLRGIEPGHMLRHLLAINQGVNADDAFDVSICPYHAQWVSEEITTMVHGAAELASMNESLRTEVERLRNVQDIIGVSGGYESTPMSGPPPPLAQPVAHSGQTRTGQTSRRSEARPRSHHSAQTSQLNRIHDDASDASAARGSWNRSCDATKITGSSVGKSVNEFGA